MGYTALAGERERLVMLSTFDNYIVPSYAHLADKTRILTEELSSLCITPGEIELNHARKAFKVTVDAWSSIEWFRVGPILSHNRLERFFYFPDRKSRGLRQVQTALAKQDETVLDVVTLQKKSVALQGLGAIDFLLFGNDADALATGDPFRCQFARSVSENLFQVATTLAQAWEQDENLRAKWSVPNDANTFFRTDREAMNAVIGTIIHGLEAIRDTRIDVFLMDDPNRDRPRSAALWRSKATMMSIAANLKGLDKLFTQSRIETILPKGALYLGDTVRFEFEQSIKTAQSLDAPIADLLADPDRRNQIEYLRHTIDFLIERLNDEFATAAGIAAGFSFGDGD